MESRPRDTEATTSPPDSPPEGAVHAGPGPRLRRAGRTAAILAVLAFVGLLTFLSVRYSHDFGQPAPTEEGASTVPPTHPLSADRIEEYARRRLEEQLRAAQPAPSPPDFDPYPEEGPPPLPDLPPPMPGGAPPSQPTPSPRLSIDAPLVPARASSGSASAAPPGLVNGVHPPGPPPPPPDLPTLDQVLARAGAPEVGRPDPADLSGAHVHPSPEPLGQRSIEVPRPGLVSLEAVPAPSRPVLYARTTIPLVLTHGVSTDVPGPIRAYVVRDIYDSLGSRTLLIPRGTLAIGHQAAHAAAGDQRVLVYWTELKFPNGVSYHLPNVLGGSQDGTAGVLGDVDNHWWSRIGSAIGLSLIGAGVQLSQPQQRTDTVTDYTLDEGQVVAQQLGLELGRLSQEILRRGVNRPPTIQLRAGERLSLILARDLAFAP